MGSPNPLGGVLVMDEATLRRIVGQVLEETLNKRDVDPLQPLARILGISAAAARKRCERDAALAKLGVPIGCGGRLHFRPSEVLAYGRAKAAK